MRPVRLRAGPGWWNTLGLRTCVGCVGTSRVLARPPPYPEAPIPFVHLACLCCPTPVPHVQVPPLPALEVDSGSLGGVAASLLSAASVLADEVTAAMQSATVRGRMSARGLRALFSMCKCTCILLVVPPPPHSALLLHCWLFVSWATAVLPGRRQHV
jgi:hypothetical protein